MKALLNHYFSGAEITELSGGDINQVYKVVKERKISVVKINSKADFPLMFEKEARGLELLKMSITTPTIFKIQEHGAYQFLEIEYFEEITKNKSFWMDFGHKLAKTHQNSSKSFGLEYDNFIGSLVQMNAQKATWESFLIEMRLMPMIEMAVNSGEVNFVEAKIIEKFYKKINDLIPIEPASLIHGDLWSGNYIASKSGPVLIDPAVYYGHREIDLAMMKLFGGFDPLFFNAYNEVNSLEKGWESRVQYHQLYPLLVHLNLFGRSYWEQIQKILNVFN
jgi:fructosamine-3-kinase